MVKTEANTEIIIIITTNMIIIFLVNLLEKDFICLLMP